MACIWTTLLALSILCALFATWQSLTTCQTTPASVRRNQASLQHTRDALLSLHYNNEVDLYGSLINGLPKEL